MLTAFFGDTHGQLDYMFSLVRKIESGLGKAVDLDVQVGDFGAWRRAEDMDASSRKWCERHDVPLETGMGDFPAYYRGEKKASHPVLFIRGNHEDQAWLLELEKPYRELPGATVEVVPNFFFLPDGHIVEWKDSGIRFAG